MALFRLTGTAVFVGEKPWKTKDGSRSGVIPICTVEVNEFVQTEVTIGDTLIGKIAQGELVDLVVDVESTGGGYQRARAMGYWPKPQSLHSAKAS